MLKNQNWKTFIIDTLYYIGASILYSLSIITFAQNADFAPGGISGLALILNRVTSLPVGVLSLILNLPLILLSWRVIGHGFILKSIWTMLINTFFLDVIFPHIPQYTGNPLLASMFTGVIMGVALAIIYMRGSSTGGSDFIILSVKKLKPHFSVGQISLVFDALVILAGGFVFQNVDAVLYGIISSFATTFTMDSFLYGAGSSKLAIIITNYGQEIAEAISNETGRGSTLVKAIGTYTGQGRDMLYCACSKSEIYKVRTAARSVDPDVLFMITEANEIIGEGFIPPNIPGSDHSLPPNNSDK